MSQSPVFDEAGATNVSGLYLIGDLVVGKKGGSIITAFNSECLKAALARMPTEWRRALLLCHVEGLSDTEFTRAIGRAEPEIERVLEHAREYLRQKLIESGCSVKGSDRRV
jgi:DNA-directed RNA polymerase specialized sigma24 family protein